MLDTIELTSSAGRARISRQGAQVLEAEFGGEPLLWLSPLLDTTPGRALRGGVPICFPWFGKHPQGLPAHGFARNRDWTLLTQTASRAVFALEDDEQTRALWPHRFHAELAVTVGEDLAFEFSVENRDEAPFCFTYALHSYFAVGDCRQCTVEGLTGRLRREVAHVTTPQAGIVTLAQPIDAIFERAPDALVLHEAGRGVRIEADGMLSAIVWNPGEAGAAVADIGAHWPGFACVERGNVGGTAITLAPGAVHRAALRLRII